MSRNWILVAGTTGARMFESHPNDEIRPLKNWADNDGHLKSHELETDGQGSDDVGLAAAHPDHQNHVHAKFAPQVGAMVNNQTEHFDELIVVAPDQTLGELRAAFSPEATRKVTQEIHKNWTQSTLHELPALLKKALEPVA